MESAVAAPPTPTPERTDILIAAGVTLIAQLEVWLTPANDPASIYAAAALAMTAPLAWRRVAPLGVLLAVFVPLLAMAAVGRPLESAYITAVLLLAFSAVGAYCERPRAVTGLIAGLSRVDRQPACSS